MSLAQDIKQKALDLGFDLVGITDARPIDAEQTKILTDWLKYGFAGQMSYMHRNLDKRTNPSKLLENAKSVIVVGLSYKPPGHKPPHTCVRTGRIASYAQYEDYHDFIKNRLRRLVDFIAATAGPSERFKICVDSAPAAERTLAARASLGFIGKNRMLINPTLGPQILLGEITTTVKLQPDEPMNANCSGCNKCIEACPTGALRPDGQFDANKCISYLTIEYKGQIPSDSAKKIGDQLFGCDECILACPYQKNAPICKNQQFKFYADRADIDLQDILKLNDEQFEIRFAGSVIKRLGLDRLQRNARICLANVKII